MTTQAFFIRRAEAGRTVADVLKSRLRLGFSQARQLVQQRRVRVDGSRCDDPARRVKAGQRLEVLPVQQASKKSQQPLPGGVPQPVVRYVDAAVVVVDKPSGLTTMRHAEEADELGARARRFLPATLADLLPALLAKSDRGSAKKTILSIHRLDKETSGLVVFARTPAAASRLGKQFRDHTIERRYLALVRGKAKNQRIESYLVHDRGDGRRGSTSDAAKGKSAVTHVDVVENLGAYTLVECRLETGRTHQVRIHLGEQGTPLCGERIYDRPLHGPPLPDASGAKRPLLHAARLGFKHPRTGKWLVWDAPLPEDMAGLLRRYRKKAQHG
jgi:23S rRNA pseudouridine1911/1915/1917 synthase